MLSSLIDCNVSYGNWPFRRFPFKRLTDLRDHLKAQGVTRALVSHLGTVFHPDPHPYNLDLIEEATEVHGINPIPVVNPMLAGWQEDLGRRSKRCR